MKIEELEAAVERAKRWIAECEEELQQAKVSLMYVERDLYEAEHPEIQRRRYERLLEILEGSA